MYSHQPKNKKIAFIISLIQSQTTMWLCKYYLLILMIAKINLLMKKLLHFIMVVKTWLHITAKHVTVIFVNFASLITIKTLHLPKALLYLHKLKEIAMHISVNHRHALCKSIRCVQIAKTIFCCTVHQLGLASMKKNVSANLEGWAY